MNSNMSEEGLDVIRSIRRVINDQDEKIWRVTAIEKYMRKEIDKLREESKRYQIQIEALKSESLYRSTKDVPQLIRDAIDHEIQTHQLLLISINSKNVEIEYKKRDNKIWDEKYNAVINDYKEAYEERRAFYEKHNHAYKQLKQSEIAQKLAIVEVKQLKAKKEAIRRTSKDLSDINRKILHAKILNFVKAISRQKQDSELNVKLQKAIPRRRELGQIMLETQKAWKTQNSINIQRRKDNFFSNVVQKIDFSRIDNNTTQNAKDNHSAKVSVGNDNMNKVSPLDKKKLQLRDEQIQRRVESNKIKVIANKKICLPPLKSILSEPRSSQKRERLSQESNLSEKSRSQLNMSEEILNSSKIMDGLKKKVTHPSAMPNPAANMSSEYLKNLKFITKLPQSIGNPPMRFPFSNRLSADNQNQRKIPVPNAEVLKRKIDSESQNENAVIPSAKKEKNVNFATPIEEHFNTIDHPGDQEADADTTLRSNVSLLELNMLEEETVIPADSFQDSQIMNKPFSFSFNCSETSENNNMEPIPVTSPPSMFQDIYNSRPAFSFSFRGGMSEGEDNRWNLFK